MASMQMRPQSLYLSTVPHLKLHRSNPVQGRIALQRRRCALLQQTCFDRQMLTVAFEQLMHCNCSEKPLLRQASGQPAPSSRLMSWLHDEQEQ